MDPETIELYRGPIPGRILFGGLLCKASKVQHCCSLMRGFLKDHRGLIFYSPQMREYYVPLRENIVVQCIFYCPWCSKKLPESVRDHYFDILENECNVKITPDMEEEENFPKEFLTDEWWKKRNL